MRVDYPGTLAATSDRACGLKLTSTAGDSLPGGDESDTSELAETLEEAFGDAAGAETSDGAEAFNGLGVIDDFSSFMGYWQACL